ncbi:MAG: bifunctional UDP-N-acetylglucosamine diphosphorylase/glucosamine-1-phosphate N-acetyltransferase GlmU [Actinomycetota bacterium]
MAKQQDGNVTAIVLAAGQGKRMKSRMPKVLHVAGGRPLVAHVLEALRGLDLSGGRVVVSSPDVKRAVESNSWGHGVRCVAQERARGTADAVRVALEGAGLRDGVVLVTQGGSPLIRTDTFRALLETHSAQGAVATLLTALVPDPYGYGRILRTESGDIEGIVEERDATEGQRSIQEINAGTYVFEVASLLDMLGRVRSDNDQGEYYLPDVLALLHSRSRRIASFHTVGMEVLGVKSRTHLAEVAAVLRRRTCEQLMSEGVTIIDPHTTYIDVSVKVGRDALIQPFTFLEGDTSVAEMAQIGPQARIVDSEIGPEATVAFSVVLGSKVGPRASVGPFASLRPGTELKADARIGTFVEAKQTVLGEGSKAPHLSYLGDAVIGKGVNVGAGTITCNWDGRDKHETVIEDEAYIGSDTMLIAPARVGRRAATGAGAVVRGEVPDGALAVGVPARVIEGKGDKMGAHDEAQGEAQGEGTP